jgi:uncharacterized repeat protein (TIGR03943 family)
MEHTHSTDRAAWFVHWTKLAALFSTAAFLMFAYFAGWVRYFVATDYLWLPPAGAVALALMGLARLTAAPDASNGCCDCECSSGKRSSRKAVVTAVISLVILIVPIALALAVQPKEFSPEGMRKRRLTSPRRDVKLDRAVDWILGLADASAAAEAAADTLTKEPTLLELMETAAVADPDELEGKFVTVIGRCDLPAGESSRRFEIYRLLVTCCVADASAVSVEVARNDDVRLESGGWVRIGGVLKFDNPIDPTMPVVHAATISKVSEPSEPYL